jgi:hypothetical protein
MTDSADPACEPPCPVAEGAMGLLCTCGNAAKRWQTTSDRLIADRDATLDYFRRGLDIDPTTEGACRD